MIEIKQVKIKLKSKDDFPLLATASVNISDTFIIRGLKLLRNEENGELFVCWPSYKDKSGKHIDIVFSNNEDFYKRISNKIIFEYKKIKEDG